MALAAGASAQAPTFEFSPKPRWAQDPDTEVVCAAIAAECPGKLKDGQIDTEWSYADLYDADGKLAGVRSLQSTGCRPLDEHLVLSHRDFRTAFSKPGQPDLEDISVEVAAGTPRTAVRLIKRGTTQVSIGC